MWEGESVGVWEDGRVGVRVKGGDGEKVRRRGMKRWKEGKKEGTK